MSEATKIITPTPGRAVWYYPSQDEINAKQFACNDPSQPLAATVAYVWGDRMINLSVLDQNGNQFRRTSVALVQPGDEPKHTSEGPFAEWPSIAPATHPVAEEERAALVSDKDMAAVEKAAIAKKGGKK